MRHRIKRGIDYFFPYGPNFRPESQDVMLVSYPKSGNTWVRSLIANTIRPDVSLQSMERLVPDIYKANGIVLANAYRTKRGGRILKSHEPFSPSYKRVIYIFRDPRDICVSYFHYLMNVAPRKNIQSKTLDQFVELFLKDIDSFGSWAEHVNSWRSAEKADILEIRYEDLLSATAHNLDKMLGFIGIESSREQINDAVNNSELRVLQRKEEMEKKFWGDSKRSKGGGRFFREGRNGAYAEMSSVARRKIERKWGKLMQDHDYL